MSKARKNSIVYIDTIADLRNTIGSSGDAVDVLGYYTSSDNVGVRQYVWDAVSVEADNGGTIIQVTGVVTGRWKIKYSGSVNVKWFGAVGDGITDDTIAIQMAYDFANISKYSLPGMVISYSSKTVLFPSNNKYLTTGNINVGNGITTCGIDVIITSGVYPYPQLSQLFINIGNNCCFDGIKIFGFTDIFNIATGNIDASIIEVKNCEVQEFSGIAINVDNNSASTLLKIHGNKFYPRLNTSLILKNQCDICIFDNNWVEGSCDTFFWNFKSLYIRGMLGVPTASTANSRWVLNQGENFSAKDSRFGGEAGSRTLVDQNTGNGGVNATKLSIENCEVYTTGFPVVRFNDIPDVFIFERNYGLNGSLPFQFNAVPTITRNTMGTRNTWVVDKNQQVYLGGLRSSLEDTVASTKSVMIQNSNSNLSTENILFSNIVRNILYTEVAYTPVGSIGSGMTSSVGSDFYGEAQQIINGVNGDSNFNISWSTLMSGLSGGVYTLLVNLEVTQGASVLVSINGGNNIRTENLTIGKYTLSVPFYFDGTNSPVCGYTFKNLSTGTSIAHSGLRVISGMADGYKKWNSETFDDVIPTIGYCRIGDRVIKRLPVVGQPKAWICTVSGTPGTWVSEGNL